MKFLEDNNNELVGVFNAAALALEHARQRPHRGEAHAISALHEILTLAYVDGGIDVENVAEIIFDHYPKWGGDRVVQS